MKNMNSTEGEKVCFLSKEIISKKLEMLYYVNIKML